ncbi:DUF2345 domain-containing protein, partial [Burkholderia contaminans]
AGFGLAAECSAHIASGEDVAITSGRHVGLAVGRSLFASVSNTFSLFVHKAGMALVAAAGKVRIEAQTDGVDLTAKKTINITSTADSIHLHAADEIVLHAGSTEIRISERGYVVKTAGEHTVYAGSHQTFGPESMAKPFPGMPGADFEEFYTLRDRAGKALPDRIYQLTHPNGRVVEGRTNAAGHTVKAYAESSAPVHCEALPDDATDWVRARYWDDEAEYKLDFARISELGVSRS